MLSDRIKQLRKSLGLTQSEFGKRISVSIDAVKNLEYNRVTPSDITISMIVNTFGVSEDWLRTGEGEMFRKASRAEEIERMFTAALRNELTPEVESLLVTLGEMTDEELAAVADWMRRYTDNLSRISAQKKKTPEESPSEV